MTSFSQSARHEARRAISLGGMLLCLFLMTGCCDPTIMGRYSVNVTLQGFKTKPPVDVYLVAVNAAEDGTWREYSMTTFASASDRLKQSVSDAPILQFGPTQPASQTFSPADPKWEGAWKKWEASKATTLFVLASLPGKFDDKPGDHDQRRRILPLSKCSWDKLPNNEIKIVLTPASLQVLTPPKQP